MPYQDHTSRCFPCCWGEFTRNGDLAGRRSSHLCNVNVVGGYMVTDRMLGMFKVSGGNIMSIELGDLAYILASALFIFGLKMLGSPATARRGNLLSTTGMLIAIKRP